MINPNLLNAYEGEYYPYGRSVSCNNSLINHGTGIPLHEVEALARILLPQIQAFFESEEGQKEFAEWKEKQETSIKIDQLYVLRDRALRTVSYHLRKMLKRIYLYGIIMTLMRFLIQLPCVHQMDHILP